MKISFLPGKGFRTVSVINFYVAAALVFFMPFYKPFVAPLVIAWFATWIFEGNFRHRFRPVLKNKLWPILLFFALHLISFFYSSNPGESLFDTQVKLPLLLFPLAFLGTNRLYEEKSRVLFAAFTTGCILASACCIGHSFYLLFKWDATFQYFTYEDLSVFMHPSYFSMYTCFALAILLNLLRSLKGKVQVILCCLGILFLLVTIYLLSAKAGIICSILILFLEGIRWTRSAANFLPKMLVLLGAITILVTVSLTNDRFGPFRKSIAVLFNPEKTLNPSSEESSEERILIWKASLDIIAENFWTGTGNGDLKEELLKKFSSSGNRHAEEKHFNAHNQYLETFICTGVGGFAMLLLIFGIPWIRALKEKDHLTAMFLMLVMVNMLFESMLNREAGTLFIGFFYSVLIFRLSSGPELVQP